MALQKETSWKGVTANYWKIISASSDFRTNKTTVLLGLYNSKTSRDADVNNFLERKVFEFSGVDLTREQEYVLIKESNIVDEVETNWFADATNC